MAMAKEFAYSGRPSLVKSMGRDVQEAGAGPSRRALAAIVTLGRNRFDETLKKMVVKLDGCLSMLCHICTVH